MVRRIPVARGDRGQILIITALATTMLLAIAALSLDASFMYNERNRMYAAADAGAKSAAIELRRSATSDLHAFANHEVALHGFDPAAVGTSVVVNNPPLAGPYAGQASVVEVIVSRQTGTFFGRILGVVNLTPGARAVAGTSPGSNCIVTLGGPGSTPPSLVIGSSSVLTLPGCDIADDGDLSIDSSAAINAHTTGVTGTCSGTGGGCSHVTNMSEGVLPTPDPLATLAVPANPGGCPNAVTIPGGGTPTTLLPGCYSSIDATATGTNVTLSPGLYYFTGPVLFGNYSNVSGSGVLLYFAGTAPTGPCTAAAIAGCISVSHNATWNLSAQTTGTWTGILMMQAPTDHLNASFDGNNPLYNLSGAMYFPGADVSFRNGLNTTNDCTLFVARSLNIDHGSGTFSNTCAAYGGSPILTVAISE
jgi:hypothetical protein